jgi:hypothetical protein
MLNLSIIIFQLTFIKIYTSPGTQFARAVEITPDSGYLVVGDDQNSILVFKTDKEGNVLWEKFYGNPTFKGYHVKRCDSGYIIVGSGGDNILYILKINEDGDVEWQKTYYGKIGFCIDRTFDNGFIIGGSKNWNIYLMKINNVGDSVWSYEDSTSGIVNYRVKSVESIGDSGYIVAGFGSGACMYAHSYVIRMDLEGNIIWRHDYGWSNSPYPGRLDVYIASAHKTLDEKYIEGGVSEPSDLPGYSPCIWIIKANSNGEILWGKEYPVAWMKYLEIVSDSGFVMIGDKQNDIYFIKFDKNGDLLWEKLYNVCGIDTSSYVKETPDKGFIITGYTYSDSTNFDIFLIKTDSTGYVNIKENCEYVFKDRKRISLILNNLNSYLTKNEFYNIFGQKLKFIARPTPNVYFILEKNKKLKIIMLK